MKHTRQHIIDSAILIFMRIIKYLKIKVLDLSFCSRSFEVTEDHTQAVNTFAKVWDHYCKCTIALLTPSALPKPLAAWLLYSLTRPTTTNDQYDQSFGFFRSSEKLKDPPSLHCLLTREGARASRECHAILCVSSVSEPSKTVSVQPAPRRFTVTIS